MSNSLRIPSVRPAAPSLVAPSPVAPSNDDEVVPESGPVDATLAVDVRCDADAVRVTLTDPRRESVAAFGALSEGQRAGLALDGWTIGLRAVLSAHRLAEESRLETIGDSLVSEIEKRLATHLTQQQSRLGDELRHFFDPRDGQVSQRLESFLKDDGELSRTLATYLAPESGALAKTLAREVGAASPLLKKLSPTDTEGVVCLIQRNLEAALQQSRSQVAQTLDPHSPGSPMARLFEELRREVSGADKDQAEKLARITKALDANDKTSAISRLYTETQSATQKLLELMNPERPGSALATLRSSLTTALEGHRKLQAEALAGFAERQRKLEQCVQEAVTRLETQKKADAKSPRGGFDFEDAVARFTGAALAGGPHIVDLVGAQVGAQPGCKVGDLVVSYAPGSPYAGSKLVIEVKHDRTYTITKALEELSTARRNRGAAVGLLVFAASHAPPGFAGVRRFGEDILVAWDPEDAASDPYLEVALLLGLALSARSQRAGDEGDLQALSEIEGRIASEIKRHTKMRELAERIRDNADSITHELDVSDKKLGSLLKDAKKTLQALNVELEDATTARKTPVGLPAGSLGNARRALGGGGAAK